MDVVACKSSSLLISRYIPGSLLDDYVDQDKLH